MTTPAEVAADYYAKLKPGGVDAARKFILNRTPAEYQTLVAALIDSDLNPPPDPSIAEIHNGQTVNVKIWDNSTVPGIATVAGGDVTNIVLNPVATKAIIAHNGAVVVHSLADANLAGSPGTATVAGGVFTKANLTV